LQPFYQYVSCSCCYSIAANPADNVWLCYTGDVYAPLTEFTAQRIADTFGTVEARFGNSNDETAILSYFAFFTLSSFQDHTKLVLVTAPKTFKYELV